MNIKEYLKDRQLFIIINLTTFIIVGGLAWLFDIGASVILMVFLIWFGPLVLYIAAEYGKNKIFYDELEHVLNKLDKKFLLPEVIKEPDFIEGKILYDILKETYKDMHENVKKYRDMQSEYQEYIETWVHEIKTPVASSRLIINNNENPITKSIEYEIKRIEEYIEQVLYYSKSSNANKDYIIKEISLADVARGTIKRNSRDFINKKIAVDMDGVKDIVYSDPKWLEFILNQVVGNSIKYCKEKEGKITLYSDKNEKGIVLTIKDNGVGIVDRDISRVFEKGFTGENGRIFGKSTGIGLYLCMNLCDKLGLGLALTSKAGEGTEVNIIFPVGDMYLMK